MARSLRLSIFNTEPEFSAAVRPQLMQNPDVRIVAEVDEPALIAPSVKQFSADVLLVNLDPNPEVVLAMVADAVVQHPKLAVFAVSQSTDGQLILSAMRSGVKEFLTNPIDIKVLTAALAKVTDRLTESAQFGKLVTVLGSAGGVGATTLAINLATELRDVSQGDVCVVDLDYRFGQVATFLDCDPKHTIADLCDTPEQPEPQMVERALTKHSTGIRILARPMHFGQAEGITAAHCVGALTALLAMHDYVVVDGPNRYDGGAKAVMDMADANLVVLQLLVPSVRNAARLLEGMRDAGLDLARVKLVCNRVRKETGSLSSADVMATLQFNEIFGSIPDEWAVVSEAVNLGEALITNAPKSKARAAIRELAAKLHGVSDKLEEKGNTRGSGLLSKIFSD